MLGTKRSVPLWRQRRTHILALERSLAWGRDDASAGRVTPSEMAVTGYKAQLRRAADAKRKIAFSKG